MVREFKSRSLHQYIFFWSREHRGNSIAEEAGARICDREGSEGRPFFRCSAGHADRHPHMRPDIVAGHGGRPPVRVRPPAPRDLHGRRRIRDRRPCKFERDFYEGGSELIGRALAAFEILVSAYALSGLFSELCMRVFGCGVYIPRTPEHLPCSGLVRTSGCTQFCGSEFEFENSNRAEL